MDRLIIQIDVPSGEEALEELKRSKSTAIFAAWSPGGNMKGWELAAKVKQIAPDTPIIILADYTDTELDADTQASSPFIYLHRPFEIDRFLRILNAALDGEDVFAARDKKATTEISAINVGPQYSAVPELTQLDKARSLTDKLMSDLNAMAILLCTRDGTVLAERGTVGYVDRDELSQKLMPTMTANIEMKEMVGGNVSLLQFYDGEEYDIYILSVGLHHFMAIIFDGQRGARELGAVSRYGRRTAEDLIGLLGAEAWIIRREQQREKAATTPRKSEVAKTIKTQVEETDEPLTLARAELTTPEPEPVSVMPQLEAIPDDEFDLDKILGGSFDDAASADLFSMDALEELAKQTDGGKKGTLTPEEAANLGLIQGM
jgi:CheY-like chemotaxis protein